MYYSLNSKILGYAQKILLCDNKQINLNDILCLEFLFRSEFWSRMMNWRRYFRGQLHSISRHALSRSLSVMNTYLDITKYFLVKVIKCLIVLTSDQLCQFWIWYSLCCSLIEFWQSYPIYPSRPTKSKNWRLSLMVSTYKQFTDLFIFSCNNGGCYKGWVVENLRVILSLFWCDETAPCCGQTYRYGKVA